MSLAEGRTGSKSQCDIMMQVRALELERLKFQLHGFLRGFAQMT